jgi:competence protein ComEC
MLCLAVYATTLISIFQKAKSMIIWSFFDNNFFLASLNSWLTFCEGLKQLFLERVMGFLKEPYFSFLVSLILGGELDKEQDIYQHFKNLGLLHLLSISGYNINIIFNFTRVILGNFFSRRLLNIILFGALLLYLCLIGGGISILRASFMLGFSLVGGGFLFRQTKSLLSLLLVCLLFILFDSSAPSSLSFQFSVGATLAILLIYPQFRSFFISKRSNLTFTKRKMIQRLSFYFKDAFLLNIAILFVVLPLQLYYFGQFNYLSLLANLILVWMILILTNGVLVLFILVAVDFLLPLDFLLKVLALILSSLSYLFLGLVEFFASFDFSDIRVGQFSHWWIGLWYLLILVLFFLKSRYEKDS